MRIRFLAIDPNTGGDHCPAFFLDEETRDLLFQGTLVTDLKDLGAVVRLPARMRAVILDVLLGLQEPAVQHPDAGPRSAAFVDEGTGDLMFQGTLVTDLKDLEQVATHSPIAEYEAVVRLPARMRAAILEVLLGIEDPAVQRADSRN